MSAPIRSLPPSAVGPSAPAASPKADLFPETTTGFSDLLDLKVEDAPEAPDAPEKEQREKPASTPVGEMWTMLGIVPTPPPPIQVSLAEGFTSQGTGTVGSPPPGIEQPNKTAEGDAKETVSTGQSERIVDPKVLLGLTPAESKQKLPGDLKSEPKGEQIAGKDPERAAITGGTPGAKHPLMMLTSELQVDSNSVPEPTGISSGEVATVSAKEGFIPSATLLKPKEELLRPEAHKNSNEVFLSPAPFRTSEISGNDLTPRPAAHLEPTKVVESISSQIQLLRTSQIGELKVIVRPDSQTELYLHITRVNGDVCVQARCERGDFAWLDSNWGVVQNALSNHGVRVDPLQPTSRTPEQPNNSFSGDHHSPRREQRTSGTEFALDAEPALRKTNLPRPSTTTSRARGWQSWA